LVSVRGGAVTCDSLDIEALNRGEDVARRHPEDIQQD
jgi:hypothetical protein